MKKWAKILAFLGVMVIGLSAGLAGCATTTSITNTETEIIYNGNVAVNVDGYVYFGNSFIDVDEITDNSTYSTYASQSYLARVDTNTISQTSKDYSPTDVSNVSNEVTAYENSFMFVLGNYIYYATPYTREMKDEDGAVDNYYSYTTIYRSKLNGSGKKELYSTDAEISQIEALKDSESGTYYIVIYAGSKLISINLSNSKTTTLSEDVTSVAMPETYNSSEAGSTLDFNGRIYYTATHKNSVDNSDTCVYSISLAGGDETKYASGSTDVSFIGRQQDVVFFSMSSASQTHIYMLDVSDGSFSVSTSGGALFTTSSTLSDFRVVYNSTTKVKLGYIFSFGSNLAYCNADGSRKGVLTIKVDGETVSSYNIISLNGRTLYFATTTGIYFATLSDSLFTASTTTITLDATLNAKTIVTMTAIYDGDYFAYDGEYIYFYAQLETLETDEDEEEDDEEDSDDEEEEDEEETDENYYLYRVKAQAGKKYSLLSLTTSTSRHSS